MEEANTKLLAEYDNDFYEETGYAHMTKEMSGELREKFDQILGPQKESIIADSLKIGPLEEQQKYVYDTVKKILMKKYEDDALEAIKNGNLKIEAFMAELQAKCPCGGCPRYIFDPATNLYKLNAHPEDKCVYANCAVEDAINMVNDWFAILKTKKLKRGSHRDADLSLRDCDAIVEKCNSTLGRTLMALRKMEVVQPGSGPGIDPVKVAKIIGIGAFAVLVILILSIIIIYIIYFANPAYANQNYPSWLIYLMPK